MCDVIPECFQSVPFEIKLNHLGYRLKMSRYHTFNSSLAGNRGTGVIASSRTFRPRPGRVIRDLLRQLHAAWHAMVRKH